MKTSIDYQLLDKHELMEIKGGFIIFSPSPLVPFIASYSAEIYDSVKHACNSFIAGLLGQPEP